MQSARDLRRLAVLAAGLGIAAIIACEGNSSVSGDPGGSRGQSSTREQGGSGGVVGTKGQSSDNGGGGGYCYGRPGDYGCNEPIQCRDGVVKDSSVHARISCEDWTGSCPAETLGTCQRGCALEDFGGLSYCPMTLCRENYPKHVDDPCWKEAECRPDVVYPAFGGSGSIFLTCDMATAKCVEAVLPEITDWLAPCAPEFTKKHINNTTPYGADWDSTCSGGVCAYVVLPAETCVNQGCTGRCRKDEECPAGAVCQTMSGCPSPTSVTGYCKPGARDDFSGDGLPCL